MRALFLFLIVIVIFMLIMALRHQRQMLRQKRELAAKQAANQANSTDKKMVLCAHCQTYLPQNDALCETEHCFCNAEHQQAFYQQKASRRSSDD